MTESTQPRIIRLAHISPGRLRLRLTWLRRDRESATAVADHLATLPGVLDVAVRPRTGSVLCRFEPHRTSAGQLLTAVRRHTRVTAVLKPGERLPPTVSTPRQRGSALGHAFVDVFRGLDDDVHAATSGRIDLGALAGFGLLAAGAAEVAVTRQIPAPPWFSLAWWAFRTFTMFEAPAPVGPTPSNDFARRRSAQRAARVTGKGKPAPKRKSTAG